MLGDIIPPLAVFREMEKFIGAFLLLLVLEFGIIRTEGWRLGGSLTRL